MNLRKDAQTRARTPACVPAGQLTTLNLNSWNLACPFPAEEIGQLESVENLNMANNRNLTVRRCQSYCRVAHGSLLLLHELLIDVGSAISMDWHCAASALGGMINIVSAVWRASRGARVPVEGLALESCTTIAQGNISVAFEALAQMPALVNVDFTNDVNLVGSWLGNTTYSTQVTS